MIYIIYSNEQFKEFEMDKNTIAGSAKIAKGNIKKVLGTAVDSPGLKAEGEVDVAAGRIQSAYGKIKDVIKES
jgi:uncharacterized protein YjbJ (UPF0337 family)